MRLTIYLPRDAEEVLDRLVRAHGGTRSQVLADLLRQADRGSGAIQAIDARLDRIEALLREGVRPAETATTTAPNGETGESDTDRSMAALRAWVTRDDEDD